MTEIALISPATKSIKPTFAVLGIPSRWVRLVAAASKIIKGGSSLIRNASHAISYQLQGLNATGGTADEFYWKARACRFELGVDLEIALIPKEQTPAGTAIFLMLRQTRFRWLISSTYAAFGSLNSTSI